MIHPGEVLVRSVRGQLFLALNHVRGRPLRRFLRQLATWQQMPPDAFDLWHERRLHDMLAYAGAQVPLYRTGEWERALRDGTTSLHAWPVLEREVVATRGTELRAVRSRAGVERQTSGSSGRPVRVALSREAETWSWALRYRMLMWHGVAIDTPVLRLSHDRHPLRDLVLGHRHVPVLGDEATLERVLGYLRRRALAVTGPPSVLFQLARRLREVGITSPLVPFARSGGEQLFAFQRSEIQEVLAERVADSYASTETGMLAAECPAGSLHVCAEHVHLEIFRGAAPVEAGESGDIVVTTLGNPVMPLVRYRLGDRGRLSPDRCRCGMPHPVLADLRPRADDAVVASDGSRHHASVLIERMGEFFRDPAAVNARQLQLEQLDQHSWRARVEAPALLHGEVRAASLPVMEARLTALLRETLGAGCRLEVGIVERLDRPHGKFRYSAGEPPDGRFRVAAIGARG